MKIGVLILAAGYSQRMGENKALLKFNTDFTFLDQLISQYQNAGINEIKVIIQHERLPVHPALLSKDDIQFIRNGLPQLGRSYSIHKGLQEFKSFDFIFIQNIDNPFTSSDLIKQMVLESRKNAVIIPKVENKSSHPILLAQQFILQILNQNAQSFDFRETFSLFPKHYISWENKNIRANINTTEEYKDWF